MGFPLKNSRKDAGISTQKLTFGLLLTCFDRVKADLWTVDDTGARNRNRVFAPKIVNAVWTVDLLDRILVCKQHYNDSFPQKNLAE